MTPEALAQLMLLENLNISVFTWFAHSLLDIQSEINNQENDPSKVYIHAGMIEAMSMAFTQWQELVKKTRSQLLRNE